MTMPNLGDAITKADIDTKGTGSYAADYVAWARVAHILQTKAPGWQFHLSPTSEGCHVWKAPNGTAYVVGYFTGPDNQHTPDFPQAVMDNRNAPIPFDKVSARDLTDTHRRCLCTAAAFTFGLAWQLWAKETVEDPHREEPSKPPLQQTRPQAVKSSPTPAPKQQAAAKPKQSPEPPALDPSEQLLDPAERDELIAVIANLGKTNTEALASFQEGYRKQFGLAPDAKVAPHIQAKAHGDWAQQFLASLSLST